MKSTLFILFSVFFLTTASAFQTDSLAVADTVKQDTIWKTGGLFTLTFSQSGFNNWAAGGDPALAANSRLSTFANYKKNKIVWDNSLDLAYGFTRQDASAPRKNDDLLELNSKFGYLATKKWYYSAMLNVKSQFYEGREYSDTASTLVSDFLSPLNVNLGLGLDYKPNDHLSVFISPLNSKMVYVKDTIYAPRYSIEAGKHFRSDLGFIVKAKYQNSFFDDKMALMTKLDLFANYQAPKSDIKNIFDLNWELLIGYQVFKALSFNLNTQLIWDNDVKFDGSEDSKWQFKEIFGLGVSYKF